MTVDGKKYTVEGEPQTCSQGSVNYMLNGPRGGQFIFTLMKDGRAFILKGIGSMSPKMVKVSTWSL